MIRHTVIMVFEGTDESIVDTVISELRGLPALIPEIIGAPDARPRPQAPPGQGR